MKLQRQFNRRVKGKEYGKWLVVIPPADVDSLGWKEGQELEAAVHGSELRLRPVKQAGLPK